MGLSWFIALRHLVTRRRQSLLTVFGVALGAMIMVTTLSLTDGLITDIETTIIEASPHLVVKAEEIAGKPEQLVSGDVVTLVRRGKRAKADQLKGEAGLRAGVSGVTGVVAVAPFVEVRGILRRGNRFRPIVASGVDPALEARVTQVAAQMQAGRFGALSEGREGIVLGRLLAKALGVATGDRVRLTDAQGRVWPLRVVGIFKSGIKNIDEAQAYLPLGLARDLRGWGPGSASGLAARVQEPRKVAQVAEGVVARTGHVVDTWEERNRTIIASFKRNNMTTLILVVFTFIVSGFGITNVLNTVVLEKVKDIAVLKGMGLTEPQVTRIFLLEGLVLGVAGALLGALLGYGLSTLIGVLPFSYGDAAFVQTNRILMTQHAWFYELVIGFSVLLAVLASVGPTRKAARLVPVAVFRGY
ncbi:MAG: ABC transporter permease [Candidatus Sericytochromatia bacterium]|nr:ABC transporter permease [Candidatus Sericytochromatia bacterium]